MLDLMPLLLYDFEMLPNSWQPPQRK